MTLEQYLENKWLVGHQSSKDEILRLLLLIERDLSDCSVSKISPDWRLAIAYNAALQCANTALLAAGYRVARGSSHHYMAIESLEYTLSPGSGVIRTLDAFRKKRNISDYERAGTVSEKEVQELYGLASGLFISLKDWLKKEHPELNTE